MAKIDMGTTQDKNNIYPGQGMVNDNVSVDSQTHTPDDDAVETDDAQGDGNGIVMQVQNGPNGIQVTIADTKTPIIVLFGPPDCGKTMTLVRLSQYLYDNGYTVDPDTSFRPASDTNYKDMCAKFRTMLGSNRAALSTNMMDFMLVGVYKGTRKICQILESPGESYFKISDPNAPFPNYVNAIINGSNRKIWAIMLEPHNATKLDTPDRRNYVHKIADLKRNIRPSDKVVFVLNKIDATPYVNGPGNINDVETRTYVKQQYPNVFEAFRNTNPITRLLGKQYNSDFVALCTGSYSRNAAGTKIFTRGQDEWPRKLWKVIEKRIRG